MQEGEKYTWGTIAGVISVPLLIGLGVVVLGVFVWGQSRNTREPLLPLRLFADRNFSMANIAISAIGFSITAMAFPFMLYAQAVRGMSPTTSALLLAPMAVFAGALAPVSGRLTDRVHPRGLTAFGITTTGMSLLWLSRVMTPGSLLWPILVAMGLMGLGSAFMWAPLGATATRNLPLASVGAGSGVYNTTRQVGAVLGSAAIAALLQARLAANLPGMPTTGDAMQRFGGVLPPQVERGFAQAMADAMVLPAVVLLVGVLAALFFERPSHHTD